MMRKALFIFPILFLFLYQPAIMNPRTRANARIIDVPTDFPTVQSAINNASDGDIVLVKMGTYYENVIVNKTVVLMGENRERTVIDANDSGTAIKIVAENVTVANLTIRGGGLGAYDSGVFVDAPFANVTENSVVENGLFGIYLNFTYGSSVSRNTVKENMDDGVVLLYSHNNSLLDNVLTENKFGLHMYASDQNSILQNTFLANTVGGVNFFYSSSNQLLNNNLTENTGQAIILDYSSNNNLLTGNTVKSTVGYGLSLGSCSNNRLRANSMSENTYNFYCEAFNPALSDFINDIDVSNTVNGKPIYYLINQKELLVDPSTFVDIGYLALVNCTYVNVQNIDISQNGQGLLLAFTNDTVIRNVKATKNAYGIQLLSSVQNTIDTCLLTENDEDGITLDYSSNQNIVVNCTIKDNLNSLRMVHETNLNKIIGNLILNNSIGLYVYSFDEQNIIKNNTIANNIQAILMIRECTNNTITRNTIANNTQAINFTYSSDNLIFNNDFINNTINVSNVNSTNTWDDGYPSGGNYWSQYTDTDQYKGQYQNETGSDGIWDHPFIIDEDNKDNYPIVPEFSSLAIVPLLIASGLVVEVVYKKRHQTNKE